MNVEEYCDQLILIRNTLASKGMLEGHGLTESALAILAELGYDRRRVARAAQEPLEEPATEKQKALLKQLKLVYPEDISKTEASRLIDERLKK